MKYSAADARRDESASPFSCQASTQAPDLPSKDDRRFQRRNRLTRGAELQSLARDGKRIRTASLDVRARITTGSNSRIGFIVPKHGQTAVRRNRLKRILRELSRTTLLGALRSVGVVMDVVMRARATAYSVSVAALRDEFETLRSRLLRLPKPPQEGGDTSLASGT